MKNLNLNSLNEAHGGNVQWLGIYRIAFAVMAIFFVGIPNYFWTSWMPELYTASPDLSVFNVLKWSGKWFVLLGISFALQVLFFLLLIGKWTRTVSILITLLLIVGNSFRYSFGKIDHDILFVLTNVS